MVKLNRTRIDFLEEFQRTIDEYNSRAANVEAFFAKLMAFMKSPTPKIGAASRSGD